MITAQEARAMRDHEPVTMAEIQREIRRAAPSTCIIGSSQFDCRPLSEVSIAALRNTGGFSVTTIGQREWTVTW